MHCSVRTYRVGAGTSMDDLAHIVDEGFADRLAGEPGFMAYEFFQAADGTLVTMSVFESEEGARRSIELAADFVREELADFDIERLDAKMGEVLVSRAAEGVLQPTHH